MKALYKIGEFVEYRNSNNEIVQGIISRIDNDCKQKLDWLSLQNVKSTAKQLNGVWYGVLIHGDGSVTIQEDRLTKINAFAIENFAIKLYHPNLLKFIPFQKC